MIGHTFTFQRVYHPYIPINLICLTVNSNLSFASRFGCFNQIQSPLKSPKILDNFPVKAGKGPEVAQRTGVCWLLSNKLDIAIARWLAMSINHLNWIHTVVIQPHRIHGAGIYANMTGGILMGSMLPYIAAPWILWELAIRFMNRNLQLDGANYNQLRGLPQLPFI